jgi:hypothetical protein
MSGGYSPRGPASRRKFGEADVSHWTNKVLLKRKNDETEQRGCELSDHVNIRAGSKGRLNVLKVLRSAERSLSDCCVD